MDDLDDWVMKLAAYITLAEMIWRLLRATEPEKDKNPRRKRKSKRKCRNRRKNKNIER